MSVLSISLILPGLSSFWQGSPHPQASGSQHLPPVQHDHLNHARSAAELLNSWLFSTGHSCSLVYRTRNRAEVKNKSAHPIRIDLYLYISLAANWKIYLDQSVFQSPQFGCPSLERRLLVTGFCLFHRLNNHFVIKQHPLSLHSISIINSL